MDNWGQLEKAGRMETIGQDAMVERFDSVSRLKRQKKELELRLSKVNELLVLLEKNPTMEQIINLTREIL